MASRKNYQPYEVQLPELTYVAGSSSNVDLTALPAQVGGRVAHISGFKFLITFTPTLSSGNVTPEEAQRFVRSLTIKDGAGFQYFQGTLASLRLQDAQERGFLNVPEGDALATTEQGDFVREFNLAPAGMVDPTDYVQPAVIFRGGLIQFGWDAITAADANITALTAKVRPIAILELHDEVIFGTRVERIEMPINNQQVIPGEGIYTDLALCNSVSLDAITAGDFSNVSVNADGFSRDAIHVADLEKMYHGDKNVPSGLSVIHGEPRTATDDNAKMINGTALVAAPANISPVLWAPDGCKQSKLIYASKGNLSLKWSGSQTSAYLLATRLVPRTAPDVAKCEGLLRLNLPIVLAGLEPRLLSKKDLSPDSPRRAYVPMSAKILKAA